MAGRGQRIILDGFEELVAEHVATSFKFTAVQLVQNERLYVKNLVLKPGTHLLIQEMPTVESLKQTDSTFNVDRDPTILFTTGAGEGLQPTASSGARHEWNLRVLVRYGVVHENCKSLLDELTKFLLKLNGKRLPPFIIKKVIMTQRPLPFRKEQDKHSYCFVVLTFMAVPFPS